MNSRRRYGSIGEPIELNSNYFLMSLPTPSTVISKFSLSFRPEIPESQSNFRTSVLSKARPQLLANLGKYVFANTALYAVTTCEALTINSVYEGVDYTLSLTNVGDLSNSLEQKHFYNKFVNSIQSKLNLVNINRKFFNPKRAIELAAHNLTVWPGYATSVGSYEVGSLLNIDISHRCIRSETVYYQLSEFRRKGGDYRMAFSRLMIGSTVITLYNNCCYRIDEVLWDSSPSSSFFNDPPQLMVDYYLQKWNKQIQDLQQPLLLSKHRKMDCLLVPEFCVITGLTDEMRSDFLLMRDLAKITQKSPQDRLQESIGLARSLMQNASCTNEMNQWKVQVSQQPLVIQGKVLPIPDILMGDNRRFKIKESGIFDRDVQGKMYEQPALSKWGVFFVQKDQRLVEKTMNDLQKIVRTFAIQCGKPALFAVQNESWANWEEKLRRNIDSSVQMILCVLPGARGKSQLYDHLKRFTFSELPVCTQVVLTGTLKKEKGIISVLNKIMIQINAKIGGVPWSLAHPPLSDRPTMVVGIDVYHKKNSYSVLGFCASTDRNFAKFVSVASINAPSEEICSKLAESFRSALNKFQNINRCYPQRVIVFRDGVSDSQRSVVQHAEVGQFLSVIQEMEKEIKLIFIVVNKRINARFYHMGKNPPLGTCVDREVVLKESYEFFIMPAKASQGTTTPTHFVILFDNSGVSFDDLEVLTYRLCFAFYNWTGAIRVPAPCQYAHKLAYIFGERANRDGPPIPHESWKNRVSLFFL